MRRRNLWAAVVSVALLSWIAGRAQADTLTSELEGIIGTSGLKIRSTCSPDDPNCVNHVGHFTSTSASTLGLLVGQLASSAADFPAISTTPGFTYRYNEDLKLFERSSGSLGSVFVDRAETVGKGRFDVGASYLYVDFDTLDGDKLKGLTFTLKHQDTSPPGLGNPTFENDTIDITFQKFSIRSHVYSFFATYGVTDNLDLNVLVPVVNTSLEARATAQINNTTGFPIHQFPDGRFNATLGSIDDDRTGLGDVLLRAKYRLSEWQGFNFATGLTVRVPSGDRNDFQGVGDTNLTPVLIISRAYGPHDVHANFGLQANLDDTKRDRARYAVGTSLQLIEGVALLFDLLGSSNLQSEDVSKQLPVLDEKTGIPTGGMQTATLGTRTDIIDLAVGLKYNPWGSSVIFLSAITPLNSDGLRSDIIPAIGGEISF